MLVLEALAADDDCETVDARVDDLRAAMLAAQADL
jgi:hypothetical protein